MVADIITIAILIVIGAYSVYSIIRDKRNGVPTCGYTCAGCSGSCSQGVNQDRATKKQVREFKKRLKQREANR